MSFATMPQPDSLVGYGPSFRMNRVNVSPIQLSLVVFDSTLGHALAIPYVQSIQPVGPGGISVRSHRVAHFDLNKDHSVFSSIGTAGRTVATLSIHFRLFISMMLFMHRHLLARMPMTILVPLLMVFHRALPLAVILFTFLFWSKFALRLGRAAMFLPVSIRFFKAVQTILPGLLFHAPRHGIGARRPSAAADFTSFSAPGMSPVIQPRLAPALVIMSPRHVSFTQLFYILASSRLMCRMVMFRDQLMR